MITHWDEVDANRRERGHIAASWQALTGYNSITVGVQRIAVDPGRWATPLHLEGSEEEIFYVLSGTGFSYQAEGDEERAFPVGRGDCLVHRALEHAHTIGAGDEELVLFIYGAPPDRSGQAEFSSVETTRLSRHSTRWPRSSSASQRWEPRKPAPPVTSEVGMRRC